MYNFFSLFFPLLFSFSLIPSSKQPISDGPTGYNGIPGVWHTIFGGHFRRGRTAFVTSWHGVIIRRGGFFLHRSTRSIRTNTHLDLRYQHGNRYGVIKPKSLQGVRTHPSSTPIAMYAWSFDSVYLGQQVLLQGTRAKIETNLFGRLYDGEVGVVFDGAVGTLISTSNDLTSLGTSQSAGFATS